MAMQIKTFVSGIIFLALLTLIINLAISLKLFLPESVTEWIGSSSSPRLALWIVSILAASFVIVILKLGVKLPFLKHWVERPDHPIFTYILGLPLGVALSVLALSGFGLVFLGPVCQSPFANIEVTSINDESIEYDGRSITAKTGARLTLTANVSDSSLVFCTWSSTGSAIRTIGPRSVCTTQASLSDEPSRGIITLTLVKNFCSVQSTNPLEIIVVP